MIGLKRGPNIDHLQVSEMLKAVTDSDLSGYR